MLEIVFSKIKQFPKTIELFWSVSLYEYECLNQIEGLDLGIKYTI